MAGLFPFCLPAAPQLVCTNRVCEFGTLTEEEHIEHTFVLENAGDEDIVISKVRACCGGTSKLESKTIAPGTNALLHARVSLAGRRGAFKKSYYVRSNDPNWPFFKLTFKGSVEESQASSDPSSSESIRGSNSPSLSPAPVPHDRSPSAGKVIVDYYFEPGCRDCERVRNNVLPTLYASYRGQVVLNKYDVGITSNYIMLAAYQDALGITEDEDVCMVVDYGEFLNGYDSISAGLLNALSNGLAARVEADWVQPTPLEIPDHAKGVERAEDRVAAFTWSAVALAGLIDGINPCAIGTLVFFMSLLVISRVHGRKLLAVGISFCVASFVTYMAIGFGLLHVLYISSAFPVLQKSIEVLMVVLLVFLALMSFRDAYRYGRSGNPEDVSLQLSDGIKKRIRNVMRRGLSAGNLIVGSFVAGVLVTCLESVCTGQVYVPTLVMVVQSGDAKLSGLGYLLVYNVMFVLPLIIAFIATYKGTTTEQLIEWSKRNVVPSKVLLGSLFLALATLILIL